MDLKLDKTKKIIVLSGLLIFQIILAIFLNFFSSQSVKSRKIEKNLLRGFNKDAVVSFEISDYQDTFSIEKKGTWVVKVGESELPGDTVKIESYLDALKNLPQGFVRDKGEDASSDIYYGFDKLNYQKVVLKTKNKKEFVIYIGSAGSKRGTSYVRLGKEKKVREVKSFIATETSNQYAQWAKRKIFDEIKEEDVEKCEIDSSMSWYKGFYALKSSKSEEEDKIVYELDPPSDKKVKQYALQSLIREILNLNISNYKINGSIAGKKKLASIELFLKNGKNFKLDFFKSDVEDPGDYILTVDFNNYLYLIDENDAKRIIKSKNDLVE